VKPPRWTDVEAVFSAEWALEDELLEKFFDGLVSEFSSDELARLNAFIDLYDEGDWETEEGAVKAAMQGDPGPLAYLLERHWGLVKGHTSVDQLSVKTRRVIVEHVRRGGAKRKQGRPKKDTLDRLWDNKVHYAAAILPLIEMTLRRMYPSRSSEEIRDLARVLASLRGKIPVETLDNYLKRKRTDRRRLPGV
jgi:hypothetical protein